MKISTKQLATAGVVAALYTSVCLIFAPLGFGPIQIRFSEAFTILCVLSPTMIWGVSIGCAVSNLVGTMTMGNPIIDVFIGTAATAIAGIISYKLRSIRIKNIPLLSSFSPVIINAIIVGAELTFLITGGGIKGFAFNALSVGAGQIIPCMILGNGLLMLLESSKFEKYHIL